MSTQSKLATCRTKARQNHAFDTKQRIGRFEMETTIALLGQRYRSPINVMKRMIDQSTNTTAMLCILVVGMLGGCSDSSDLQIDYVTFGIGLPPNSKIIASKSDTGFAPDGTYEYLIFDTDSAGIATFAKAYTGGPLDSMIRSRTELNGATSRGSWMDTVDGLPWDLAAISDGRFSRHAGTNGFLSIDLNTNRVYVFR